MPTTKILTFIILLIFQNINSKELTKSEQLTAKQTNRKQKHVIFVHGTLFPITNLFVRTFDCPIGFSCSKNLPITSIHKRALRILSEADSKQFPMEFNYVFGWTGRLNFTARKKAAKDLYKVLKTLDGEKIVIGHSHGGNVALNLAQVVLDEKDKDFKIDKLVLLATPALTATQDYVKSPIFKNIISFYSLGDRIQVRDPQGLYKETKIFSKNNSIKSPLFSQRIFPESKNLIQVQILDQNKNISHLQFILESFLKSLPATLNLIDEKYKNDKNNYKIKKCTINI